MSCITISSSTGSTSSSAHFTLWVNWLPMLLKFNRIILWSKNKSIHSVFCYINELICYTYILRTYNLCHILLPNCIRDECTSATHWYCQHQMKNNRGMG
jgi:hypothetical protein